MNVVRLDGDAHAACEALLPWYALGQVDADERAELEAHLAGCASCRSALARERELQRALGEAMPDPPYRGDAKRGFAMLRARIEAEQPPRAPWWSWPSAAPSWWRGLLFAQAAVICLLMLLLWLLMLWPRGAVDEARFRGLGQPPGEPGANAVVSFAPGATEAQLREALRASNARLVGGPTASHAYLVALPAGDAQALARLRAQPGVALAVSLESGSSAP